MNEAEQFHHVVILTNALTPETPIGIGFADEHDNVLAFVPLDLPTANKLGERFCEAYNEMLTKIRGDT